MKMRMNIWLRQLLLNPDVGKFVTNLFNRTTNSESALIKLKQVNKCLMDAYANRSLFDENPRAYHAQIEACNKLPTRIFVDFMLEKKVIKGIVEYDDDSGTCALRIDSIDRAALIQLTQWVNNSDHLIVRGLFSLNTKTGSAYFRDNETTFKPGSGHYELFKSLLTTTEKYLTFSEIVSLQQREQQLESDVGMKGKAIECIKYIKKKLKLSEGIGGKLLPMYEQKGFTLVPYLVE